LHKSLIVKYGYLKYFFLILPSLIAFFVLGVYPNLQVFQLAFYKWNGISKKKPFVGLQNFETFLNSPKFVEGLMNTVFYILFLFLLQTVVAILISVTLKRNTTHNKFFRTFFFLPLVFSSVMVGLTWSYMYDPNLGVLNQLLTNIGLDGFKSFNWLGDPARGVLCIVLVHIWANLGYPITIITAGLQTIPDSLYEAAEVEGANPLQTFRKVTLPLLLPILMRVTILTITTGAMAFDYVYLMGGSTGGSSPFDTWAVGIYRSLGGTNIGMPSAQSVILSIVLFLVFLLQFVVTKKVEDSIN
jgi:raffinose/stachyose/melibiose transport system permease protein